LCRVAGDMAQEERHGGTLANRAVCRQTGGKRDRYKRLLAVCYVGDVNLNAMMVRNGWALAYRRYSTDYVDAEGIAEKAKAGLWRGEFEKPWVWRRK